MVVQKIKERKNIFNKMLAIFIIKAKYDLKNQKHCASFFEFGLRFYAVSGFLDFP